jgi:hypothetical protein
MKTFFIAALTILSCSLAQASAKVVTCNTSKGKLTYVESTSSIINEPVSRSMELSKGALPTHSNAPTLETTVLGDVVSMVYIVSPSHDSVYVSLIIPKMTLSPTTPTRFKTLFLTTDKKATGDTTAHEAVACQASIAH